MLTRKGHSLIMWVVIFSALTGALAVIQVPLKRALKSKAKGVTDYVFWKQWGVEPKQHLRDETNWAKSKSHQQAKQALLEKRSGENTKISAAGDNYQREKQVSSQVQEGSESALKTFDLNQFDLDPD